jgi:hypothetical protein
MIDELKDAIYNTVTQFQEHPLDFLSESDIQALLFVELRNATKDLRYSYDGKGVNHRFGFSDQFSVHPITTEYHVHEGKNDTVDQIKVDVEIQKDTKCIVNLSFSSTLYLFTA